MADNTNPFQNTSGNQGGMGQNGGGFPPPANPNPANPGADPFGFPPAGGGQGGFPPADDDGAFPGGPFPPQEEDNTPANFQLGSMLPPVIEIKIPAHSLQFDEQYFLHLLAGSISLTKEEKARIIDSMPRLRQSQVDELIRIFEEERKKFAELSAKHVDQLKKLEKQHFVEWQSLELDQKAAEKKNEDQAKADAIRKSLGL